MLTKQCQAHLQQTTLRRALRNMNLRDDKCQTCSEHKPSLWGCTGRGVGWQ